MALSFRSMTLGQLTADALDSLLGEHETLFVEHKTDIAQGDGWALSKAVASFANALGGWVLIGVAGGETIADWSPPPGDFVDTVRQRLEGNIDPMPAFAASVHQTARGSIGVVRVYESSDTPHLVRGTIYVREPAKDRKNSAQPPYQPTAVRSHYELSQLVRRGESARADANARLAASGAGQPGGGGYGLPAEVPGIRGGSTTSIPAGVPSLALRLAPITMTEAWRSWSVRPDAPTRLSALTAELVSEPGTEPAVPPYTTVIPRSTGIVSISAAGGASAWTPGGDGHIRLVSWAGAERLGVLTVLQIFEIDGRGGYMHWARPLEDGGPLAELLLRLLKAACRPLAAAELLGRYRVHLSITDAAPLFTAGAVREPSRLPRYTNFDGELVVDGRTSTADARELQDLATGWAQEMCRAAGLPIWTL